MKRKKTKHKKTRNTYIQNNNSTYPSFSVSRTMVYPRVPSTRKMRMCVRVTVT